MAGESLDNLRKVYTVVEAGESCDSLRNVDS